jgi:hypothetical protein
LRPDFAAPAMIVNPRISMFVSTVGVKITLSKNWPHARRALKLPALGSARGERRQ